MRLTRITIKNYKSIPSEGVTIEFRERLLVLIGKNNAGKSNLLEAAGFLFGAKNPRYLSFDGNQYNDPSQPIIIEAEVIGATYGDGKSVGLSDAQCHALMRKERKGSPSASSGKILLRLEVPGKQPSDELTVPLVEDEDSDKGEEDDAKQSFTMILADKTEVKRNDGIRRALVSHILVPPTRERSDILSPSAWTAYGRMLRDIVADSGRLDELVEMIDQASTTLREILSQETKTIAKAAKSTAYVDDVTFQLTKDGNPIELLRSLSLSVTYSGRTEDISTVGTGTQSAIIIGVLELCLRHKSKTGLRLFVVEEPELFLHPQAQRYFTRLLQKIAEEEGSQVIITTHSPTITADLDILDVIRVHRDKTGATGCRRIPTDFDGLDRAERILTSATSEMLFADRAVLVEGPSELELLPSLSTIVRDAATHQYLDFDRLNISVVSVGGKNYFAPFTSLLDHFGIDWRIVADQDALTGDVLASYHERAEITSDLQPEEKRRRLLRIGVGVLRKGEIEDYYPDDSLAAIGGCSVDEVSAKITEHKIAYDEPTTCGIVKAVICDHFEAIKNASEQRLPKLAQAWYSQSIQNLRQSGEIAEASRKTGEALEKWLHLSKPLIALNVARWMLSDPSRVPPELVKLVRWLASGLRNDPNPIVD